MSPEQAAKSGGPWEPLDTVERRLLGVLVEKQKTTPDAYPLSVNALVTGSNQKSNRDPILTLSDMEIEESLGRLVRRGLVERVQGGRVERWRHLLYAAWSLDKVEMAIVAELLLRGPQTEGELRGRASRMEPVDDLDRLRSQLKPLAERKLVVYLTSEDRRGAVLTHGFHDPSELERLRSRAATAPAAASPPPVPASRGDERLAILEQEIASLKKQVADLQAALAEMRG
jgi:uncharacterized protein YceH (UPF0502 family)